MIQLRENDFKYVMQDLSHIYIGGRMSYEEVGEQYDTPSRLKSAIYRVVIDEAELTTPVGEHLLTLTPNTKTYLMYKQLAAKIKVAFMEQKVDKKGIKREEYVSRVYAFEELANDNFLRDYEGEFLVQEIIFSKRRLMSLAV